MPDKSTTLTIASRGTLYRLGWLSRWTQGCRRAAADLLCPPQCQFCGGDITDPRGNVLLCAACFDNLVTLREAICPRCAAPVPVGMQAKPDCPRCDKTQLHFSSAVALGVYRKEMADAVRRIKHPIFEPLALALGCVLANEVRSRWPDYRPDLMMPVPMYWGRRWLRGHNGPELLAESAARDLRFQLVTDALLCRRNHKRQSTLAPSERFANVRGTFAASRGYALEGAKILLVDDTMTTGATASEAARMLKNAGAAEVRVAVAARGIGAD